MECVAALAANRLLVLAIETITDTWRLINSSTSFGIWSLRPSPSRYSILTFLPSV
jgi:hypothetical protein